MRTILLFSKTVIAGLALFTITSTFAQAPPQRHFEEKRDLEGMKIAFITARLNLSREEAQKFWPVYNEYQDARNALRKEKRDELKDYGSRFDQLNEKELTDLVDKQIIYRQRELDLQKKYHAIYKDVLPIKKIAELYKAEDDFKMQMLNEAKKRNED